MSAERVVIIGAGGQARDLAYLIEDINAASEEDTYDVLGFVVSDLNALGPHDSDVLGDETWLSENDFDGIVIGIGSPGARLRVGRRLRASFPGKSFPNIIHPRAAMQWQSASLGEGIAICDGVIGTVNIVLGDFVLLNPAVTLGHEAQVGAGCVMNHASGVSGAVILGEGVLIGTGARVLQYLNVGARTQVGAGAVVTRDLASDVTAVGVPARARS